MSADVIDITTSKTFIRPLPPSSASPDVEYITRLITSLDRSHPSVVRMARSVFDDLLRYYGIDATRL